jgi:hypothetical protein
MPQLMAQKPYSTYLDYYSIRFWMPLTEMGWHLQKEESKKDHVCR